LKGFLFLAAEAYLELTKVAFLASRTPGKFERQDYRVPTLNPLSLPYLKGAL